MDDVALTLKLAKKYGSRDNLAAAVGITVQGINNWIWRKRIAPDKRAKVRELARAKGIRLPERWIWDREAA